MKNKAKCKLCKSIIESFHSQDYVICKCGEISVDGGEAMRCASKNWDNFLRVDDDGNEIVVKVKSNEPLPELKIDRKSLIEELERMVENLENLPDQAKVMPVTQFEISCLLSVIVAVLKLPEV